MITQYVLETLYDNTIYQNAYKSSIELGDLSPIIDDLESLLKINDRALSDNTMPALISFIISVGFDSSVLYFLCKRVKDDVVTYRFGYIDKSEEFDVDLVDYGDKMHVAISKDVVVKKEKKGDNNDKDI